MVNLSKLSHYFLIFIFNVEKYYPNKHNSQAVIISVNLSTALAFYPKHINIKYTQIPHYPKKKKPTHSPQHSLPFNPHLSHTENIITRFINGNEPPRLAPPSTRRLRQSAVLQSVSVQIGPRRRRVRDVTNSSAKLYLRARVRVVCQVRETLRSPLTILPREKASRGHASELFSLLGFGQFQ